MLQYDLKHNAWLTKQFPEKEMKHQIMSHIDRIMSN